jgi:hypothetical protein
VAVVLLSLALATFMVLLLTKTSPIFRKCSSSSDLEPEPSTDVIRILWHPVSLPAAFLSASQAVFDCCCFFCEDPDEMRAPEVRLRVAPESSPPFSAPGKPVTAAAVSELGWLS